MVRPLRCFQVRRGLIEESIPRELHRPRKLRGGGCGGWQVGAWPGSRKRWVLAAGGGRRASIHTCRRSQPRRLPWHEGNHSKLPNTTLTGATGDGEATATGGRGGGVLQNRLPGALPPPPPGHRTGRPPGRVDEHEEDDKGGQPPAGGGGNPGRPTMRPHPQTPPPPSHGHGHGLGPRGRGTRCRWWCPGAPSPRPPWTPPSLRRGEGGRRRVDGGGAGWRCK